MIRWLAVWLLCAAPAYANGWEDVRWGMSHADLRAHLGPDLHEPGGTLRFGSGLYATQVQDGVDVEGLVFRAIYQFFTGEGLVQVLLRPRPDRIERGDFDALVAALGEAFGPPEITCQAHAPDGGRDLGREVIWECGGGVLHASLIRLRPALSRPKDGFDPARSPEPIIPDIDERLRRSVPLRQRAARMVLRWRNASEARLASVMCRNT